MKNNRTDNGTNQQNTPKKGKKISGLLLLLLLLLGGAGGYPELQDMLQQTSQNEVSTTAVSSVSQVSFRNDKLRQEHYQKHGKEMGFSSAKEYEKAASAVVTNPESLHKTEKEDGDDVYFLEETNEFVIVSVDGYIRTYFCPEDGIAYYNRQ